MHDPFSPTRDDVDAIAAWSVIRAARVLARRLADVLAPLDLTPVEFGVLVQLATTEDTAADPAPAGLAQADLARAVGVRPQSVTALVATLADRGLIDRGAERGRGRRSRVVLTDDGRAVLAQAYPVVLASNAWFGPDTASSAALVTTLRPMLDGPGGPDSRPAPADEVP
ncbi:MarR family winged helix-turn-helix transcriptional regulator [Curtobacterium sp. VKM Ac-2922]|uniref:MarR family winged helix-turn-helix transcriptional regulator n=1 Tax=Curtobacterium sp. VKM Ac-2922 TaxID=2929475 RepID=UPI001FB2FD2A|nr:MarR family transcriptional regulator [Curtobacterium sp. VKM Ac-2922]MCJ1714278.1 MarR family transcriptional regulator [Curtobacterium sp. VKM Ac-2922]